MMAGVGRGQEAGKGKASGGITHKGEAQGPVRQVLPSRPGERWASRHFSKAQISRDRCRPSKGRALGHRLRSVWLGSLTVGSAVLTPGDCRGGG